MSLIDKTLPVLDQLLDHVVLAFEQLHQTLTEEAAVLASSTDADSVASLAAYKKQRVQQLELFNTHLTQILAAENLPHSQAGIQRYFELAAALGLSIDTTKAKWDTLQQLCQTCKTLNEQNGACIALLSRHNQRCLQLIKGNTQQVSTYGAKGQYKTEQQSRRLFSA
ncbi:flagella synthesis protein FlgN [Methylocucumis oryzae]|uniref:Flagellar biosynthesis protein FlgN n=1 Tax=Methylocucumis oryzae TaxID=1632867 RepID=A0A0F3IM53_9GAMM|nr:flagellar protein FlgN [Methylocucumis oryzae]KJV07855.1 hypothetical protein VZ94_02040 [Methylocucumis oryzae]